METDTHAATWVAETSQSKAETDWMVWVGRVEEMLGFDVDGDQATDGYSVGGFYGMWRAGMPADHAAAEALLAVARTV